MQNNFITATHTVAIVMWLEIPANFSAKISSAKTSRLIFHTVFAYFTTV